MLQLQPSPLGVSMQEELYKTETRLHTLSGARKQYQDAVQQLELAKHALTLVEGRAKCSVGHQAQQRVDELEQQLKEAVAQRDAAVDKETELKTKAEVKFCCNSSKIKRFVRP